MTTNSSRGFTLIELVMVIVIGSIMAASLAVFFRPAVDSYFSSVRRAKLTSLADGALRLMSREIRSAVSNSIRTPGNQCFELLPTSAGGRYRMASDTVNDSPAPLPCTPSTNCSAPLDITQPVTQFDVLSTMAATPAVGDWVVIDNQNTNDVYAGSDRAAITAITTPTASAGRYRIAIASTQFPAGYSGGRFVVVPNNGGNPAVVYVCSAADGTVDASGSGKGTLYRVNRAFNATYPASCPATTGGAILATSVKTCNFIYNANQGATQQNGFLWMQLEIAQSGESVALSYGAHVENAP